MMPHQASAPDRERLWTRHLARRRWIDVVICGPQEMGKTYLAAAMASGSGLPPGDAMVTPMDSTAGQIDTVYRHIKTCSDSSDLSGAPATSGELWHVQISESETGDEDKDVKTRELSLLELDNVPMSEHPLRQEICFAPTWILLMDPHCEYRSWYLDRLPRWSRDLALPDGQTVEAPAVSGARALAASPVERVVRRVRQIVVVFTHLDEMAAQWLPGLLNRPFHRLLGGIRGLGDQAGIDRFVRRLDIEAWMNHYDSTFLQRLRGYLGGPSTEVFIGAVSSVGWRRPGPGEPEWRPFGSGELLRLILSNEARHPIQRVRFDDPPRGYLRLESSTGRQSLRETNA